MKDIDKIIELAQSQVGYKEDPKTGYNKYNLEYYGYNSAAAWCVTFIWWLFKHTGLSYLFYGGGKTASCGTLFDYYEQRGMTVKNKVPKRGDLVEFTFNGVEHCHIGMCLDYDGKYVITVDGNTSDANSQSDGGEVLIRKRSKKYIYGVIRPAYAEPEPDKPDDTPTQITYTVQKGDSLYKIGKKFGVPWPKIAAANGIKPPYTIYPGQVLIIPE